jgi:hypothetical protein
MKPAKVLAAAITREKVDWALVALPEVLRSSDGRKAGFYECRGLDQVSRTTRISAQVVRDRPRDRRAIEEIPPKREHLG